ncbi:hypothetical protein [Hathewaya limosa]|uniref:Membrane protein n=1 Tax=Hathewaya limosa TaxID=1536 RepID=A0ABU0JXL8_HATLI|nr:hypothetical protein [Hathewaya limosa]MDQ0481001.1 putative membrane protein [Hathewaya limosa]
MRDSIEEAKKAFEDLKAKVTDLGKTTAGSNFKIDTKEYTVVADGTDAGTIEKDKAYATVTQAAAIKTAYGANAGKEEKAAYEQLKQNLENAINAVKDQKGTKASELETAKKAFEDLKAKVTDLGETKAGSNFKIDTKEYTVVADGTDAGTIEKDKAYATVTQAAAIKTAYGAKASKEEKAEYEQLKQNLENAINAVKDQKGTKE